MQGSIALFAVLAAFRVFPAAILASHDSVFLDVISYIHIAWLRQNLVVAIPLAFKRSSGLAIAKNRFRNGEKKKSAKHLPSLPGIPRAKNTASASRNLRKLKCIKNLPASLPLNFLGSPAKAVRPVGPWGKRCKDSTFSSFLPSLFH